MIWSLSHRADTDALPLADRHYNRQKVGSPQFVPPGRCLVLKATGALWVTSWPFPEFVRHQWPGAFINSLFRKECGGLASAFIRDACAATRAKWPQLPAFGMVTFIDPLEVKPRKVRGRCCIAVSYFEAGFIHVGYTKAGLWAMQLTPERFPMPEPAFAEAPLLDLGADDERADARRGMSDLISGDSRQIAELEVRCADLARRLSHAEAHLRAYGQLVQDLIAFAEGEKEAARADQNRSQYEFYGGYLAALQRIAAAILSSSPVSPLEQP